MGTDEAYRATAEQVLKRKPVGEAEPYDTDPIVIDKVAPEEAVTVDEKLVFPESRQVGYPKVDIAAYPQSNLIKGMRNPSEEVDVKLSFDEASMVEIVEVFADLLHFGYQIDPAVSGSVTMTVEAKMTAKETWELFEHILWLSGAYASKNPGFVHIVPFAKMPKEQRLLTPEPLANVEVSFIPIHYVKSAEIIKNIQPFMTDGATITDLTDSNTLLIVEAPANMPKLNELIKRLDNKGEAAWPHICIQCHEVPAEDMQAELEQILPVLGYPVTNKGPSGGQIKLTSIPRLQTLVVSAALPEVLKEVERWAEVLDRGDSESKEDLFFYNVQHSTAEQLGEMLDVFFNTDASVGSGVKATSKDKSTSAKATSTTGSTEAAKTTSRSKKRSQSDEDDTVNDNIFDTPVVLFVDTEHNRLSMKTTRRAFSLIKAMLERHDIKPRSVLVEAKIVEVSLSDSLEFGFAYAVEHSNWQAALSNMGSDSSGTARDSWTDSGTNWAGKTAVTGLYPASPASFTSATGGLALGYLQGDSMAFINAVAGKGNSKVLQSPQVMATNGVEGKINIGRRVAVKTTEYNSDYKASFEYQDTGTILTVTPYITAGNDVRLEIEQEVSSVIDGTGGDGSPDISSKTLSTTLIIPSGGTAIMGGLIDTSNSNGHTGLPFLKDIPLLGRLFRTNQRSSSRNELLVLISVEVLDSNSDTMPLLKRYHAALKEIEEQLD
jgi:general secretion pathway protein D